VSSGRAPGIAARAIGVSTLVALLGVLPLAWWSAASSHHGSVAPVVALRGRAAHPTLTTPGNVVAPHPRRDHAELCVFFIAFLAIIVFSTRSRAVALHAQPLRRDAVCSARAPPLPALT
jgi:hypothetical protein